MGFPGKMKWTPGPAWSRALRYGLALASVAAALGLANTFTYFHLPQPFGAFAVSAIAITFWYGGIGPGIFAAVLSSLIRGYFFDLGYRAESRLIYDLVFLVFALLMTQVVRGRKELEQRVAERTTELTRLNDNLKQEIAEHNRVEAELRLSEAYLAEAQRLSHTGSWHGVRRRATSGTGPRNATACKALIPKRGSLDLNRLFSACIRTIEPESLT